MTRQVRERVCSINIMHKICMCPLCILCISRGIHQSALYGQDVTHPDNPPCQHTPTKPALSASLCSAALRAKRSNVIITIQHTSLAAALARAIASATASGNTNRNPLPATRPLWHRISIDTRAARSPLWLPFARAASPRPSRTAARAPGDAAAAAGMARLAADSVARNDDGWSAAKPTLFQQYIERYFGVPEVQRWLLTREAAPAEDALAFERSLSYACLYYPPSAVPRGQFPYPPPAPFLDTGDFLLCQKVYSNIAVGSLFNNNEEHALATLRDSVTRSNRLSRRPRSRKFAADLSVDSLEIIEFAWMDDDSLIVACRKLDRPATAGANINADLVLTGDLLFYDVIPPSAVPSTPMLRMTLNEKPAICAFCGSRGIASCTCPSSFKSRAPCGQVVPVSPPHDMPDEIDFADGPPTHDRAGALSSWHNYTKRIFSINQAGSFFVHWYKREANARSMRLWLTPPNPISYQFVCGTRQQTLQLTSSYVKRMKLCNVGRGADTRLYHNLSRGADIGMLMDKSNHVVEMPPYCTETEQMHDGGSGGGDYGDSASRVREDRYQDQHQRFGFAVTDSTAHGMLISNISNFSYDSAGPHLTSGWQPAQSNVYDNSSNMLFAAAPGVCPDEVANTSVLSSDYSVGVVPATHVGASPCTLPGGLEYDDERDDQNMGRDSIDGKAQQDEVLQYLTQNANGTPACGACGKNFLKKANATRHIANVHLKRKPFRCNQCDHSFGYRSHLVRHQESRHSKDNMLVCTHCSKEFRGEVQLSRHLQAAHSDLLGVGDLSKVPTKSQILCHICGVSFSQRSNMLRHVQSRHEGKRYVCPMCPDGESNFGQRYDLSRHLSRRHHLDADARAAVMPRAPELA